MSRSTSGAANRSRWWARAAPASRSPRCRSCSSCPIRRRGIRAAASACRATSSWALANEPDLLIADEPTTALDVTIQAQILALLGQLKAKFGMALLLITHDLAVVRKIVERVCVMSAGEIVEAGAAREVFESPRHPYTRRLLAAEPRPMARTPRTDAPAVMEAQDVRVWFPIRRGLLRRTVSRVKAVDGGR